MKKSKVRAYASIALFVCVIALLATAVVMEITESMVSDETWAEWRHYPELQSESTPGTINRIGILIHVIVGYIMIAVSLVHLYKNRIVFKNYFLSCKKKQPTNKEVDKVRKFISIALFVCMGLLFVTAVSLQAIGHIVPNATWAEWYLHPEIQNLSFTGNLKTITTAIHVLSGYLMVIFTIIHLKKNWSTFKSYFKRNKTKIQQKSSSYE